METIKVNMSPNPLDVQTIHASQNDGEARQWEFELHNNGELIDTSDVKEQLVFKAYKGGTEQLLPENTSTPTTSPFKGDIKYPQGLLSDQEFTYRQSPTESDGLAKITDIKGNTLVWNQLIQNGNFADTSNWAAETGATLFISNNTATISSTVANNGIRHYLLNPLTVNHKYLVKAEFNVPTEYRCVIGTGSAQGVQIEKLISTPNTWTEISGIGTCLTATTAFYCFVRGTTYENVKVRNVMCIDLTAMGLDSLTVEQFTSLFPLSYYSYNQGSLLSFNGNGIKTVGKNQLNLGDSKSATANGVTASYDASTQKVTLSGTNTKTDSAYILINFAPSAIPKFEIGETYVVSASSQIPTNTYFNLVYRDTNNALQGLSLTQIETRRAWRFTVPSNYSTFISFQIGVLKEARQLSGEFGVQLEFGSNATAYEPYTESVINLPISTYFPTGMKSAGTAYDELTPTKAITRIGAVDLGNLNWKYISAEGQQRFYVDDLPFNIPSRTNMLCAEYVTVNIGTWTDLANYNKVIVRHPTLQNYIAIRDTNYTDATAFKTAMSGVYLYYELATPTETPITTASLVTENAEIPLSNENGVLVGKCTEELSAEPGFHDAKIKLADADGECYSNKIQLHVERSPQ